MRWWRWALLLFELCLFALVLVLPQVDLPDFAFHGGTAPVVAKSKLSSCAGSVATTRSRNTKPTYWACSPPET